MDPDAILARWIAKWAKDNLHAPEDNSWVSDGFCAYRVEGPKAVVALRVARAQDRVKSLLRDEPPAGVQFTFDGLSPLENTGLRFGPLNFLILKSDRIVLVDPKLLLDPDADFYLAGDALPVHVVRSMHVLGAAMPVLTPLNKYLDAILAKD